MKKYTADVRNVSKLVIIIIFVTAILSTAITCLMLRTAAARHDDQMLMTFAAKVFEAFDAELRKPLPVAQTIAADSFLHQALRYESASPSESELKSMQNYLGGIRSKFGYNTAFVVSNASKNYYTQGGIAKVLDPAGDAHDAWYKRFVDQNLDHTLKIGVDETRKNAWMLYVDVRIEDADKNMLGVCGVSVGLQNLQKMLKALEQSDNIRITIVDKDGHLQLNNESLNIDTAALIKLLEKQPSDQFVLERLNGARLVARYIPELDWYLVVQRDGEKLINTFMNAALYTGAGFLVTLIVLLMLLRLSVNAAQR